MHLPGKNDYIDIHTHDAVPVKNIFSIDVLMAHEERLPERKKGILYSYGIHPWHLNEFNQEDQLASVKKITADPLVIAVGETGFDRIRGPSMELQCRIFEEQVRIAERLGKPVVVHCVRAWDELLLQHKRLNPGMPWLVHGFRGKPDLARQLVSRGMYISFWFEFIIKPESAKLIRSVPKERIFLETDGADVDIRDIYNKVTLDLGIPVDELKSLIRNNFFDFFRT